MAPSWWLFNSLLRSHFTNIHEIHFSKLSLQSLYIRHLEHIPDAPCKKFPDMDWLKIRSLYLTTNKTVNWRIYNVASSDGYGKWYFLFCFSLDHYQGGVFHEMPGFGVLRRNSPSLWTQASFDCIVEGHGAIGGGVSCSWAWFSCRGNRGLRTAGIPGSKGCFPRRKPWSSGAHRP